MFTTLRNFVQGERPPGATDLNLIVQAIRELQAKLGDAGAGSFDPIVSTFIALDAERFVMCKITEVKITGSPHADSLPGQPAYLPSQIKYHVVGIGEDAVDEDDMVPYYGRPARYDNVLIHPAREGDTCWIERNIDDMGDIELRLGLLQDCEVLAFAPCTAPEE